MHMPACGSVLPAVVCSHGSMLAYLVPAMALAVLSHILAQTHPFFFILSLPGTICHELAHYLAGLLTLARPTAFTVMPRKQGRHWELGSVMLTHVRWYNAAPASLAPLVLVVIPFGVAWWRTRHPWHFEPVDLAIMFLLAPQFLSFWPSKTDWKLALRSWPYLIVIGIVVWVRFNL